jgi:hypothetical protein
MFGYGTLMPPNPQRPEQTYAACVEQAAQRLYWALVTSLNLTAIGCDVGNNAFAEAPAPMQPFYMNIDDPFRNWWENCLGRAPIPQLHMKHVSIKQK